MRKRRADRETAAGPGPRAEQPVGWSLLANCFGPCSISGAQALGAAVERESEAAVPAADRPTRAGRSAS